MSLTRREAIRSGALMSAGLVGGLAALAQTGNRDGAAVESPAGRPVPKLTKRTAYIAAYDTESPRCLAAVRKIVEVHQRFKFPATFFMVGRTLEGAPEEYRRLLDDPLFEIASHTYSHRLLREHPLNNDKGPRPDLRKEIFESKATIERTFQRPCLGIRSAWGFAHGLTGARDVLTLIAEAGYKYSSSQLWGPDYTLPALLTEPYTYLADGHPTIWEFPGHGWHENILKSPTKWGAKRLTLWPAPMPEAIPSTFLKTPDEEFALNRVFLDKAATGTQSYVSFIWHPWSLGAFDPSMRMLEQTFAYVQKLAMKPTTFARFYEQAARAG